MVTPEHAETDQASWVVDMIALGQMGYKQFRCSLRCVWHSIALQMDAFIRMRCICESLVLCRGHCIDTG